MELTKEKREHFFTPFILSKGIFVKIYVLSQCVVYWIHFPNIHTFTYQKTLLHTLLLLVFKIVESLQCILKTISLCLAKFIYLYLEMGIKLVATHFYFLLYWRAHNGITFTFSIELFTFHSCRSAKLKTAFSRKENLKKCTRFEELKGTRYIRGNVYFDIIAFSRLVYSIYTVPPICSFNGILLMYTRAREGLENFGISGIIFFRVKPIYQT